MGCGSTSCSSRSRQKPEGETVCTSTEQQQENELLGFEGVLRPDHVPTVEGDSNENAGYSSFGRLYAIGYIRGLRQAVYAA